MKGRLSELDEFEAILKESEMKMTNMKEEINRLNDERKCSEEQIKFLIDKNLQMKSDIKDERDKVSVTGKVKRLLPNNW